METDAAFFVLIDLLLAIPAASAEAERGFSTMKRTKHDWRSSLKDGHLSDLMIIQLESKKVGEFDPTESIEFWLSSGQAPRRPYYKDKTDKDTGTFFCDNDNHESEEKEEEVAWTELMKDDLVD